MGITRAEERLFISFASSRYVYGREDWRTPSRFINEISPDLIEKEANTHTIKEKSVEDKIYDKIAKKSLNTFANTKELKQSIENMKKLPYNIGEKVTHIKYGLGKVVGINEKKVSVQFVDGTKDIDIQY